eukprot:403336350
MLTFKDRLENQTGRQTQIEDITKNPMMYDVGAFGFDIAVGASTPIDPKYGGIVIYHTTQDRIFNETTNLTDIVNTDINLELVQCETENFLYADKQEVIFKGVNRFQCIKDKSYLNIGGTFLSSQYKYLKILLIPCQNSSQNGPICATPNETYQFFRTIDFQLRYTNGYFAYDNFQNPVQRFIEDRLYIPIEPYTKKGADIFVKRAYTQLSDSLMPFIQPTNISFVQVDALKFFQADLYRRGYSLMQINIRLDLQVEIYTRQVYSYYNLMFQLGGSFNALLLIGTILTRFVVQKLLYSDLIASIFFVQKQGKRLDFNQPYNKKLIKRSSKYLMRDSGQSERLGLRKSNTIKNNRLQTIMNISNDILLRIDSLTKFKYGFRDLLSQLLICFKNRKSLYRKRSELFQNAKVKIQDNLDIVDLFKKLQELEIVKESLLTPLQRHLIRYHDLFVIKERQDQNEENLVGGTNEILLDDLTIIQELNLLKMNFIDLPFSIITMIHPRQL